MTLPIEVRDLRLNYGDFPAIQDLSFKLPSGGIHGLLGRNGSGKSTLLSVMAGFRKATAGTVTYDGQPVFENAAVMRQLCLIREGGDTVEGSEKIEEALSFASIMRPHWDEAYATALLERFHLSPKKKIDELSRGQRSALGVTLGLASRAPVTMFDEVHLGMDAPSRYAFYEELLSDFMEHPRTIIISTHLIEEVSSLFESLTIIDQGRLLLQEDAEVLRNTGATITGSAAAVEEMTRDLNVLNEKRLGNTRSVVVYGALSDNHHRRAAEAGLDIGALPLQDLFVHLTSTTERNGDDDHG